MDTKKLKQIIRDNHMTVESVANGIGINRGTFYRKLNAGGISFTVGEMNKIRALFNLTNRETASIFFE